MKRYIIRDSHSLDTLTWSYSFVKANACFMGLRARGIGCFMEIAL